MQFPQSEDCARATQVLGEIWRICLAHIPNPNSDPEAAMSAIVRLLDPWPLSNPPKIDRK